MAKDKNVTLDESLTLQLKENAALQECLSELAGDKNIQGCVMLLYLRSV